MEKIANLSAKPLLVETSPWRKLQEIFFPPKALPVVRWIPTFASGVENRPAHKKAQPDVNSVKLLTL